MICFYNGFMFRFVFFFVFFAMALLHIYAPGQIAATKPETMFFKLFKKAENILLLHVRFPGIAIAYCRYDCYCIKSTK